MNSETWFPDRLISDRCVNSRFNILLNCKREREEEGKKKSSITTEGKPGRNHHWKKQKQPGLIILVNGSVNSVGEKSNLPSIFFPFIISLHHQRGLCFLILDFPHLNSVLLHQLANLAHLLASAYKNVIVAKSKIPSLFTPLGKHFGDFNVLYTWLTVSIKETIWWRAGIWQYTESRPLQLLLFTTGTCTRACTYTPTKTALQSAQDGAWATEHQSVRPHHHYKFIFDAVRLAAAVRLSRKKI